MIQVINDIMTINFFLNQFNTSISNLNDPFKKYIGFKKDNILVGFMCYSFIYDRIEIEYIYVLEKYRRQNIASKLMRYLCNYGKKNQCVNITLEVRCTNTAAINFYEKNGFVKCSVREKYYGQEDGILMLKELV